MQDFIMIPRSLIYNRDLGDKRVLVYSSIVFSRWSGKDIGELITYSKHSISRKADSIMQQYEGLVDSLISEHYFKKNKYSLKPIQKNDCFGIIYYAEFNSILNYRVESMQYGHRINHAHLLLLLAHIRLCTIRQPGVPLFYSNLLSRISESIGISVRNISKCLKILEELNIIHGEELPRYKDNKNHWHSNVRIFIDMKKNGTDMYDWQKELLNGIRYIMTSQID